MLVAWVGMALAVLTKGPIGVVLPGITLLVYTVVARNFALWRRLHLGVGLLAFMAITEPWFVLVSQRNPEFLRFFFIHEHLERYLSTTITARAPGGISCRSSSSASCRGSGSRGAWSSPFTARPWPTPSIRTLARDLGATVFVFFSASSSKLPGYILPLYPALAILAAAVLGDLGPTGRRRQLWSALVFMLHRRCRRADCRTARRRADTERHLSGIRARGWAQRWAVGIVGLLLAWRLDAAVADRALVAYALSFFALTTSLLRGHETFGASSSGAALAARVAPYVRHEMPIYAVRMIDHTLPFYLRHASRWWRTWRARVRPRPGAAEVAADGGGLRQRMDLRATPPWR